MILEPFIGSLGILVFGFISIPIVGHLSGAEIDLVSAVKMSFIFFIGRFIWLYILRQIFSKNRYAK
jgi:hypothetical protein